MIHLSKPLIPVEKKREKWWAVMKGRGGKGEGGASLSQTSLLGTLEDALLIALLGTLEMDGMRKWK